MTAARPDPARIMSANDQADLREELPGRGTHPFRPSAGPLVTREQPAAAGQADLAAWPGAEVIKARIRAGSAR
jgi:hypothetical protein